MHEIYGDVHSPRDNGHSQKPEIGFYAFSKPLIRVTILNINYFLKYVSKNKVA
jgi:hypothetical protein